MRWKGREGSENVDDRRTSDGPAMLGGGLVLLIVLGAAIFGCDPQPLLDIADQTGVGTKTQGAKQELTPHEVELGQFVRVVLKDTEDVWDTLFREADKTYRNPTMVLFSGQVASHCGVASAAMGPFYCPLDQQIFIDLSFYDVMKKRLGAGGDFAQAYVIAHEVGHHVQNLLGINQLYQREMQQLGRNKTAQNALTVRMELQADFLAGVWAHHAHKMKHILEPGDVDEALNAARQIGDDALQRKSRGYVVPDSFTHGTSAQRSAWFRYGLETGDMRLGDTFDDAVFDRVTPRKGS